jgi:hypothetical protein
MATSSTVFAFVTSEEMMQYYAEDNLQKTVLTYINGIGSGIVWSDAYLEFEGKKKLFCKPEKKIFHFGKWYFEIFAEEFLSFPDTYKDMPPAVPLLRGLIRSFPCDKK